MPAQADAPPIDTDAAIDAFVGSITAAVRSGVEQLVADLGAEADALRSQLAAVQGELAALKAKRVAELDRLTTLSSQLAAELAAEQGDPPTTTG